MRRGLGFRHRTNGSDRERESKLLSTTSLARDLAEAAQDLVAAAADLAAALAAYSTTVMLLRPRCCGLALGERTTEADGSDGSRDTRSGELL